MSNTEAGPLRQLFRSSPLSLHLGGRDNNLNLLRIVAASAVLISHAFALTSGDEKTEPFLVSTGLSLGQLAVAVFFGISGLLIARSFDRRVTLAQFVAARVLRLWPGLFVVLMLIAFGLGPLMTTQPVKAYFSSMETWTYLPRNLFLVFPHDLLPGLFMTNPFSPATNGSLWSLFYEVTCYAAVVIVGFMGGLRSKIRFGIFIIIAICGHILSVIYAPAGGLAYRLDLLGFVGFPFALGMAAYVWRDRLPLNLAGLVVCWSVVVLLSSTIFFASAIMAALVYSSLWLAFIPGGKIREYNRLGDFSYGVYIFAFPIQQALVTLRPDDGPLHNIALAAPITLVCAVLSWFLIEQPAMAMTRPVGVRLAALWRSPADLAQPRQVGGEG